MENNGGSERGGSLPGVKQTVKASGLQWPRLESITRSIVTGACNMQCVLRFPTELINSFYSYQVQKLSSDRHWAGLGWAGLSDLGTVRPGDGRVKSPWEDKLQGAQVALTNKSLLCSW